MPTICDSSRNCTSSIQKSAPYRGKLRSW
uniref:Uncharacterized protein n=1 Tax=Arundo donax TaxID=35708 RepID=A0A0A8YXU7_ARUDO